MGPNGDSEGVGESETGHTLIQKDGAVEWWAESGNFVVRGNPDLNGLAFPLEGLKFEG